MTLGRGQEYSNLSTSDSKKSSPVVKGTSRTFAPVNRGPKI